MATSAEEIKQEILQKIRDTQRHELREANQDLGNRAVEYARSIAPELTKPPKRVVDSYTKFRDSIHLEDAPDVDGLPACKVVSDDDPAKVAALEYGSIHNEEFAVFARTAAHFGAKENSGALSAEIEGPAEPLTAGQ